MKMKKIALVLAVAAGMAMSPVGQAYGAVYNGWDSTNGFWQYYKNGSMCTGWVNDSGAWYYLNSNGNMATGWKSVNGTWYYLDGSGSMKTGWLKDGGEWYYLNSSGAMATGWKSINGAWYYLNGDGSMKTGWVKDGEEWYYLNSSGAMATGWINDSGKWYYLNSNGTLASNISVDGYFINRDGVWDKTGDNKVVVSTDKAEYDANSNDIVVKVINNTNEKIKYTNDISVLNYTLEKWEEDRHTIKNDNIQEFELEPHTAKVVITKFSEFNDMLWSGIYKIGIKVNGEYVYGDFNMTGENNNVIDDFQSNTTIKTSKDKYYLNETKSIPFTINNGSHKDKGFTESYWIEKEVNFRYEKVNLKDICIPDVYYELKPGESWDGAINLSDIDEKLEAGKYRIGKSIGGKAVYGYFDLSNENIAVMKSDKNFYYDDNPILKLTINNNSDDEISYGQEYKVEKLSDGARWKEVKLKNDIFTEEAVIVEPHEKNVVSIDLSNIDEEKICGDYRIVKVINGDKYYATFAYGYEPDVENEN